MSVINGYCTLADLQAYLPNSTNISTTMAERAIEDASRAIEGKTGRKFYPSIKTNVYDVPGGYFPRELSLKDDLLAVLAITNGDDTSVEATSYNLWLANATPYASIILKQSADIQWQADDDGNTEDVISVSGVWGYHNAYSGAWLDGSTLSAGINNSVTTVGVVLSTSYVAGQIIRVDNELMRVLTVSTGSLTVTRAWNGSTAASHLTSVPAYIWRAQADIIRACLIQAARYYRRAEAVFGTVGGGELGAVAIAIPTLDPDVESILEPYIDRL